MEKEVARDKMEEDAQEVAKEEVEKNKLKEEIVIKNK